MTINIITSPFGCIPPNALGAVEKLWFLIGEVLRNEGHKVSFICKRPEYALEDDNVYIKGFERTGSLALDIVIDLWFSLKALVKMRKCDYVVFNTFWSPLLSPLFSWKFKKSLYNVARFPKGQMALYNVCDILACVSTAVKDAMIEQSPSTAKRAVVVANPIDTNIYTSIKPLSLTDRTTIVYMGRVHREKGIEQLVKAIDILQKEYNVQLIVIGPTDIKKGGSGDIYVNELKGYTHGWDIVWTGPIYDVLELADLMKTGQIFCYPSLAEKGETFGVSPLESMGLGMVPIVSSLKCFTDFIEEGVNGLVYDHRAENAHHLLAEKIKYLLDNPNLFEQMSAKAIETSKHFDVKSIADQYMHEFQK